jgi:hypothetical protein
LCKILEGRVDLSVFFYDFDELHCSFFSATANKLKQVLKENSSISDFPAIDLDSNKCRSENPAVSMHNEAFIMLSYLGTYFGFEASHKDKFDNLVIVLFRK